MKLFARQKKREEQSIPKIITLKCQNCGKEHTVQYRKAKAYYLDGTPKDLEGVLSMSVTCQLLHT